jgi:hypothetical protein
LPSIMAHTRAFFPVPACAQTCIASLRLHPTRHTISDAPMLQTNVIKKRDPKAGSQKYMPRSYQDGKYNSGSGGGAGGSSGYWGLASTTAKNAKSLIRPGESPHVCRAPCMQDIHAKHKIRWLASHPKPQTPNPTPHTPNPQTPKPKPCHPARYQATRSAGASPFRCSRQTAAAQASSLARRAPSHRGRPRKCQR